MTNKLLRIEKCSLCGAEERVYESSPSTYGAQGHTRVRHGNADILLLCTRCWNKNVTIAIVFTENGWTWQERGGL